MQGPIHLQLTLTIPEQRETVSVPGKSVFANSDPVYRQLREIGLGQTFRFDNFTLTEDAATLQFQKGTLTFLTPVNGVVTGAIFIGEGHFNLKPVMPLDARELHRRTGSDESMKTSPKRFSGSRGRVAWGSFADWASAWNRHQKQPPFFIHWREKMRQRREHPLGFTEYLLEGETMDNVDADLLAAIYNPSHPEFFNAYLRGKKHKDLVFSSGRG